MVDLMLLFCIHNLISFKKVPNTTYWNPGRNRVLHMAVDTHFPTVDHFMSFFHQSNPLHVCLHNTHESSPCCVFFSWAATPPLTAFLQNIHFITFGTFASLHMAKKRLNTCIHTCILSCFYWLSSYTSTSPCSLPSAPYTQCTLASW